MDNKYCLAKKNERKVVLNKKIYQAFNNQVEADLVPVDHEMRAGGHWTEQLHRGPDVGRHVLLHLVWVYLRWP